MAAACQTRAAQGPPAGAAGRRYSHQRFIARIAYKPASSEPSGSATNSSTSRTCCASRRYTKVGLLGRRAHICHELSPRHIGCERDARDANDGRQVRRPGGMGTPSSERAIRAATHDRFSLGFCSVCSTTVRAGSRRPHRDGRRRRLLSCATAHRAHQRPPSMGTSPFSPAAPALRSRERGLSGPLTVRRNGALDADTRAVDHSAYDGSARPHSRSAEGRQRGQREGVRALDHLPDRRHLFGDSDRHHDPPAAAASGSGQAPDDRISLCHGC